MAVQRQVSDQEQDCIDELKRRLKGEMNEDLYHDKNLFYRFLRARDFNVNNAETMLRKHLQWREMYDMNNILNWKKPEVAEKYVPIFEIGEDKEGCLVRYIPAGNMDFSGLNKSMKFDDVIKFIFNIMETDVITLKKQTEKLGRIVDKCVYIEDMANFSFAQATDKRNIYVITCSLKYYQDNYPEMLKAVYVINASNYFRFAFNAVKPFMAKSILSKIFIYSDDSYKKDLLDIMDADVLPAFLGGNKEDSDGNPLSPTLESCGGPVPESYYIHRSKKSLADSPGVKRIIVSNANFYEVFLEVKEPGSYLEWEFETKCRDIGFGLFKQQKEDGKECNVALIPIQRINTDEFAETGVFKCEDAGQYVLVFDNTYSWMREKEVFYRIKVLTPEEYEAEFNG